jgi:hypothetical protein
MVMLECPEEVNTALAGLLQRCAVKTTEDCSTC